MWNVLEITPHKFDLDVSSAGLSRQRVTAISSDGVGLCNAINLIDYEAEATQVEICSRCGITRCASGGWVAMRRAGDSVLWLPAWRLLVRSPREAEEYSPPGFLASHGVPRFRLGVWNELCRFADQLPSLEQLPPLNALEAARICQMQAPDGVLGEFPAGPQVRPNSLLASTEGALDDAIRQIDQTLAEYFTTNRSLWIQTIPDDARFVEVWPDVRALRGWRPLAAAEGRFCLLLDDLMLCLE